MRLIGWSYLGIGSMHKMVDYFSGWRWEQRLGLGAFAGSSVVYVVHLYCCTYMEEWRIGAGCLPLMLFVQATRRCMYYYSIE